MTTTKIGKLFQLPIYNPLSAGGTVLSFPQLYFYVSGSGYTTQQTVYADVGLTTPLTQPISNYFSGGFVPVFMNPALQYAYKLLASDGVTVLAQADPVNFQDTSILQYIAYKNASTSRSSTITLAADPDLTFYVPNSGTFKLEADIRYSSTVAGTNPGLRWGMSFLPGGSTSTFAIAGTSGGAPISTSYAAAVVNSALTSFSCSVAGDAIRIAGTIQVTTPVTVSFSWAQNTSNATATTVSAGSSMTLTQIG